MPFPRGDVGVVDFVGRNQMADFAERINLPQQFGHGFNRRMTPQPAVVQAHDGHAGAERYFDAQRKIHVYDFSVGNPDAV